MEDLPASLAQFQAQLVEVDAIVALDPTNAEALAVKEQLYARDPALNCA